MSEPGGGVSAVSPDARQLLLEGLAAALDLAEKVELGAADSIDRTTLVCHLRVLNEDVPSALDTLEQREKTGEAGEAGDLGSTAAPCSVVGHDALLAVAEAARELLTENARYRKFPDAGRMHAHANAEKALRAALDALSQAAVPPPKALDCSRPSVEALEAERDEALEHVGETPTLERIRVAHSAMTEEGIRGAGHRGRVGDHRVYKQGHDERCYICALLLLAEAAGAGRDQAIKERDEARVTNVILERKLRTERAYSDELSTAASNLDHAAVLQMDGGWRVGQDDIEALRSALAGVPGGGHGAGQEEQEQDLGGGAAACSEGEKA